MLFLNCISIAVCKNEANDHAQISSTEQQKLSLETKSSNESKGDSSKEGTNLLLTQAQPRKEPFEERKFDDDDSFAGLPFVGDFLMLSDEMKEEDTKRTDAVDCVKRRPRLDSNSDSSEDVSIDSGYSIPQTPFWRIRKSQLRPIGRRTIFRMK